MPESFTQRGFAMYAQFQFFDYDGMADPRVFQVQESSLATERKVWVGTADQATRAHLNVEEAIKVRDALNEFIGQDNQPLYDSVWEVLEEPLTEGPLLDLNTPSGLAAMSGICARIVATFGDVHAIDLEPK